MRLALALGAACAALALSLPASAVDLIYVGNLTGPAEAPPNSSPGIGSTKVTVNTDALTMRIEATFSGLTGTTTASHIHCCVPPPGAAGVITTTPTFTLFPLGVTSGTFDQTLNLDLASSWNPAFLTPIGGNLATARATLFAGLDSGTAYLNIHTSTFPTGEIRAFLVPEPETYALLLVGLGLMGTVARRKRARR